MDKKPPKTKPALDVDGLLKQLGSRTQPNSEHAASSKEKVRQRWQQAVIKQQQRRQQKFRWAIAASIMLMATVTLLTLNQSKSNDEMAMFASVSNFSGNIQFRNADLSPWQTLGKNDVIKVDTSIRTKNLNSYITLELQDNSQISIAGNTELIVQKSQIELIKGQIYHDTDDSYSAAPLAIKTIHGIVQHVGTRYLVSNDAESTQVAVRSGQVELTPTLQNHTVKPQTLNPNQLATLTNKDIALSDISTHDTLWSWVFMAQNTFSLDQKSLYEFVDWYAHQTGLSIDWNGLENPSKRVRLKGNIINMSAEQAIKTVFLSTKYNYSIDNGVLQINKQ